MRNKYVDLSEYVKIASEFPQQGKESKFKGMHLSAPEISFKKPGDPPKVKNAHKMEKEEFDPKKLSFIRSAYVAYKCCERQNLHLFQLERIYTEHKRPLKGVARWRLPKQALMQASIAYIANTVKENSINPKKHFITWVIELGGNRD